jgi:glutathione S-transferase
MPLGKIVPKAAMKLIGSLTSPYVRKARIVLAEKHVGYDFELESPWSADSNVPDHNPLGKVPVLIMDDGTSLFDSRVIVDYLDSVNPVSRLIPEANRRRIMVKRWEALADGICDAAASVFLERKRDEARQSAEWIARQHEKIIRGLKAAAHELGDKKWCDGNVYTLADIALGCALGYLAFRFSEIGWRSTFSNLADLSDRLEKRPPFADTAPRDA